MNFKFILASAILLISYLHGTISMEEKSFKNLSQNQENSKKDGPLKKLKKLIYGKDYKDKYYKNMYKSQKYGRLNNPYPTPMMPYPRMY